MFRILNFECFEIGVNSNGTFSLPFSSQLKHYRKLYEGYVPMEYKSYIKKMKKYAVIPVDSFAISKIMFSSLDVNTNSMSISLYSTRSGEWGDHVTLQAAADRVSLIFIYLFSHSSLKTSGKKFSYHKFIFQLFL